MYKENIVMNYYSDNWKYGDNTTSVDYSEANIASECLTGHDFSDDSGTTSESSNDNKSSKKNTKNKDKDQDSGLQKDDTMLSGDSDISDDENEVWRHMD